MTRKPRYFPNLSLVKLSQRTPENRSVKVLHFRKIARRKRAKSPIFDFVPILYRV